MPTTNAINNKPDPARTAKSTMVFGAAGALSEIALTDGQLIIGNTGNAPSAAVLASAGGTVTITNGAGTINLVDAKNYPPTVAFLVYKNGDIANATGDGTAVGTFDTEIYDTGANFAANTFTAPATGYYYLAMNIKTDDIGAGHTQAFQTIGTSNASYYPYGLNASTCASTNATYNLSHPGSVIAEMDAADTATFTIAISNSTKTVTYDGTTGASTFCNGIRLG